MKILVDLRHADATPWVIHEASTGGIGPRWGPAGLIAADAGGNGSRVVIVDPATHSTRIVSMRGGGLVGGGPSIVWAADGNGIVGTTEGGAYQIVPIDGSDPRPGIGKIFDPRGAYGPAMAGFRICSPDMHCPGGDDGRIERVELEGSARTIWRQTDNDRALGAGFGARDDEYWLLLDHDSGRQVTLAHSHDGRQDTVATVNRDSDWQDISAPFVAPDQATAVLWTYADAQPGAVLVPLSGVPASFHAGQFAGFVDGAASPAFATGPYLAPVGRMPVAGAAYALPTVGELIAAELRLNPGRAAIGKASRDAVVGETETRTFEVSRNQPGAGELHLDCFGPSSVTVANGSRSVTSPCLRSGAYVFQVDATGPIIVTASGDTSWRVVVYSP
jgi:hypothetical protein